MGGAIAGVARVVYEADVDRFRRDHRAAERDFTGGTDRMKRSLGGLRTAALGITGILGITGLAGAVRLGFTEMAAGDRVARQVEARLKSTGQVAGVTADDIDRLAEAQMRKTGVDDELIKSGEAVLLTFTKVRNVAGQGNDVFTQGVQAALDLSAALGTDLQGSVIQIGKALNDPIVGLTALRRVGVSFTEAQRDQIKELVQGNRMLDAQKLILQELQVEFGGSADAAGQGAGRVNVLRESIANLAGDAATLLAPAMQDVTDQLIEWIEDFERNEELQRDIREALAETVDVIGDMVSVADELADIVGGWDVAFQLILAGTLALKVRQLAIAFGLLAGAETGAAAGGIAAAAGQSKRLHANLLKLKTIGIIAIPFAIDFVDGETGGKIADLNEWFYENVSRPLSQAFGFDPGASPGQKRSAAQKNANASPGRATPDVPRSGTSIQIPRYFKATHDTDGAEQWGTTAIDIFTTKPGTQILAPADGRIASIRGNKGDDSGQVYGMSLYYVGDNGDIWFITHLSQVAPVGRYKRGQVIGVIAIWADNPNASHAHVAKAPRSTVIPPSTQSANLGTQRDASDRQKTPVAAPNAGGGADKPKPGELIPRGLRLELAEAELTKSNADDIRALRKIETYLEERIRKERNVEKRIDLLEELKQTRAKITGLSEKPDKERKKAAADDLVPLSLQLALAEAELTKRSDDDLRVLQQVETYLERRVKAERNVNKRLELLRELKQTRARIAAAAADVKYSDKDLDKLIGIPGVDDLIDRGPLKVARGGRGVLGSVVTPESLSEEKQRELGRIMDSFEPTLASWRGYWKELDAKRKAAIARRDQLKKDLKRATGVAARLRKPSLIAKLKQAIARLEALIKELTDAMTKVVEAYAEEEATMRDELQREADEDESSSGSGLRLPGEVALAIAQAEGTEGTADDIAALRGAETFYSGLLASGTLDIDDQAAVQRELNGIRSSIRALVDAAKKDAQRGADELVASFSGFLGAFRDLRQYQGNVARLDPFDPFRALSGSGVTINNYFQQGPEDPHLWSKALEFQLERLAS